MYLPALTDRELIRYADNTADALSSTELELELLKRFAARLDQLEALEATTEIDAAEMLAALHAQRIHSADDLRRLLDCGALLEARRIHSADDLRQILDRDAQMGAAIARYADTSATFATL